MNSIITGWSWVATTTTLLSVVSGGLWLRYRKHTFSYRSAIDEATLELLQTQISALQRDMRIVSDRLNKVDAGTETVGVVSKPAQPTPYNQAIELAKRGLPPTEVASQCGISRSEAELIVSLYRRMSS